MAGKRDHIQRQVNSLSRVREMAGVRALPRTAAFPSPPTPLPKWERGEEHLLVIRAREIAAGRAHSGGIPA